MNCIYCAKPMGTSGHPWCEIVRRSADHNELASLRTRLAAAEKRAEEAERRLDQASDIHNPRLSNGMRARCAESLGEATDGTIVRKLLLPLLGVAPPLVQEGAVLALERHMNHEVRQRLETLAAAPDTSLGLRATVAEVLEAVDLGKAGG